MILFCSFSGKGLIKVKKCLYGAWMTGLARDNTRILTCTSSSMNVLCSVNCVATKGMIKINHDFRLQFDATRTYSTFTV